jgi:translation initiation factor 4G
MNMPPQAQHLRRESSQSAHSDMSNANMNRGFPPNAGRGRGFPPQHYNNNNMANQSPQPYRPLPHHTQHMGRGMAPTFQPQGPMQQNSPYRQNRSPAITPATMHQQAHLANPQGMPYYPGQPYPQQVRIPSYIQHSSFSFNSVSSVSESSTPILRTAAVSCGHSEGSLSPQLADLEESGHLASFDPSLSVSTNIYGTTHLTSSSQQAMYGMPPQGLDPYQGYYGQAYGLQQSIHYPGHQVPASPGRTHGFPQQMPGPYGAPSPYGQPPQAHSMSRTPSNMSERPSSAVPQPSTPAMTNVNHISHTHTPSVTAASPAPSSTFERPKKQSKAIVIKTGKYHFANP